MAKSLKPKEGRTVLNSYIWGKRTALFTAIGSLYLASGIGIDTIADGIPPFETDRSEIPFYGFYAKYPFGLDDALGTGDGNNWNNFGYSAVASTELAIQTGLVAAGGRYLAGNTAKVFSGLSKVLSSNDGTKKKKSKAGSNGVLIPAQGLL